MWNTNKKDGFKLRWTYISPHHLMLVIILRKLLKTSLVVFFHSSTPMSKVFRKLVTAEIGVDELWL